jgi:hypothetical protein
MGGTDVAKTIASWLQKEFSLALSDPKAAWTEFWVTFGPGGRLHPKYLLDHQYHLLVEAFLILAILYLLVQNRAPAKQTSEVLTEEVRRLSFHCCRGIYVHFFIDTLSTRPLFFCLTFSVILSLGILTLRTMTAASRID